MRAPEELGRPVEDHHPIRPVTALALCAVPGVLLWLGLWLGAVGSFLIGGFMFIVTTVLLIGLFAESLFIRQQMFEHGLLLSSSVPLTPRYIIPYAAIDPDSIEAVRYHRPAGREDPTDAFARRYRQAPTVPGVSFTGTGPRTARAIARGRVSWQAVKSEAMKLPVHVWLRVMDNERWIVSFRHNAAAAAALRERVTAARTASGRH